MTRRWLRAPLLAVTLLFVLAVPVLGARNTLSNPTVSPLSGIPSTTFTYTVQYEGAAASVTASVAGRSLPMSVISGTSSNGTFAVSTTLPVGSWPVTFNADAKGNPANLTGATVTVTSSATPRPTIAPTPTPSATQPPAPTPLPTMAPPPITATPLQPTPLPSATASQAGSGSPGASGFIGGFILTPAPAATPGAEPALEGPGAGDEMWTLVTGGFIALSALALLGMVGILRTRRHAAVEEPIRPAEYTPPKADE